MASFLSIDVEDTSPAVSYAPFADTFGAPDLSAGWNPYYSVSGYAASPGQLGVGTSTHRTSLDGASLSIQWVGTGIQLWGKSYQAGFNLAVDGRSATSNSSSIEQGLLAEFYDLHDSNHTITLTVHMDSQTTNGSFVAFDKALVNATQPVASASMIQTTLNDTDVAFLGQWSFFSDTDENGQSCAFHRSQNRGDRAEFSFYGSAITIFGLISPNSGLYNVTIDQNSKVYSAHSSFVNPDTLLYYATELDDNEKHQVIVENMEDKTLAMRVGGINFTSTATGPTPTLKPAMETNDAAGTKAAIALSCILFFFIFLALGYFLFYRPRARRRKDQINNTRRLEKEAEAGAAVLDISQESARQVGSTGTRFSFARRMGLGSQRSGSDLDIDMETELDSAGSVRRAVRRDPHSQWEAYTISIPSMRYASPSPRSSRFAMNQPPLPSPPPNAHIRQDSGARLLDRGQFSEREDDVESVKYTDTDLHDPVEINLSPRTSEARSLRASSPLYPPSVPYLTYEEPTLADELPGGQRGVKRESKFWRWSRGSNRLSVSTTPRSTAEELRQHPTDGSKRSSQVRFDPNASQPPSTMPRSSFLDFSSSSSSSDSGGTFITSQRGRHEQNAPPETPVTSKPAVRGPRPLPSISVSVPLSIMRLQPAQRDTVTSTYPRSLSVTPETASEHETETPSTPTAPDYHHLQSFNPISLPSRPPTSPLPLPPPLAISPSPGPLTVAPPPQNYHLHHQGVEESPTDSFARSVSDINFRQLDTSAPNSRRTSAASAMQFTPRAVPHDQPPMLHKPLIVQKILGMQQPVPQSLRAEERPSSAVVPPRLEPLRRAEEPEVVSPSPSTPFMQRVLRLGSGLDRGPSQEFSSPRSAGSERESPSPGLIRNLRRL